jgi:hypothetical protein
MKFTVIAKGTKSSEYPRLRLLVNGKVCGETEVVDWCEHNFDIYLDQDNNNFIELEYFNKNENHTVIRDGQIVSDQILELQSVRLDDILLDSWFITEGCYCPRYFEGFKRQVPDAPASIKSQLIWHFPGSFQFAPVPNESKFWFWYRDQRRQVHSAQFSSVKDQLRDEAYVGSLDPCQDLIQEIKHIINVQ